MFLKRLIFIVLFASFCSICMAQSSFDSTTVYHQRYRMGAFYNELMRNAGAIKTINTDTAALAVGRKVVDVKEEGLKGEATFVYELGENGERINTYITQFWSYIDRGENTSVFDYIVFVDGDTIGFDKEKLTRHKIHQSSRKIINELFSYVEQNRKFELIRPRERNLKYERVRFK